MPGRWGLYVAVAWTLLSLAVARALGDWGFLAAMFGLALAWSYSAPPLRLKENGWFGNAACGLCYEGLAWITGSAVMAGGAMPDERSLLLALLYSVAAHGIMTLNDFKSIEGDRQMGVRSLPVQLGADGAARSACWTMALPQVAVAVTLLQWGAPLHALAIAGLIVGQLVIMRWFVARPIERALYYSGFGVPILVSGMMIAAWAMRSGASVPAATVGVSA
jgi:chlorophyll synthase